MDSLVTSTTTVLLAIVGVAFIAVFLSRNSQTASVINAGGNAFSAGLAAATSPVTQSTGLSAILG